MGPNPEGMDQLPVDPVFAEVMKSLVGDSVDVREAWDHVAKLDAADVHVPSAEATKQRRQARIGLASNVLGITAGATGLAAATRDERLKAGGKAAAKLVSLGEKIPRPLSSRGGKVGAALAGGAIALQGANLAGDFVSNRVLSREAKKQVAKALDDILAARRDGQISTATAIELAEKLSKAEPSPAFNRAGQLKAIGQKLSKSDDTVDYVYSGEIAKFDDDKRVVFGYASLSTVDGEPVVDRQDDYIPIEEMEKSAYAYVLHSRKGGDMHARVGESGEQPLHTSDLIESFIVTPDKLVSLGVPEEVAKSMPTGWWVGYKVHDDKQWQMVKNGERAGFSIHGKGARVSKVLEA